MKSYNIEVVRPVDLRDNVDTSINDLGPIYELVDTSIESEYEIMQNDILVLGVHTPGDVMYRQFKVIQRILENIRYGTIVTLQVTPV